MRRGGRRCLPLEQLKEMGEKLQVAAPAPANKLTKLLEKAAECLHGIEQSPGSLVMKAIQPSLKAVTREALLKHEDEDVKVLLATSFCEITRITAPHAPYDDNVLGDIFYLIVGTFRGLSDVYSQNFGRRVAILETIATCRACVLMLDLECYDLITDMFRTFLEVVSDSHEENIVKSMQTIMTLIIDESDDVQESLLCVLLSALGQKKTGAAMSARKLARSVIEHSAGKLEAYIETFLTSSWAGDGSSLNGKIDHHGIIFDVYQCAPKVLKAILPYVTGELLADEVDIRSKSVELLGEIFSLLGAPIEEHFKSLFTEFLKRLTDRAVEIRISVVEHLKRCLISNPSRPEAPEIMKALCDRLLDYEENVWKGLVAAHCDVSCHSPYALCENKMIQERKASCDKRKMTLEERKITLEERKLMWEQEQKIMFCDVSTLDPEQKSYVLAMRAQIAAQKMANFDGGGSDGMGGGRSAFGGNICGSKNKRSYSLMSPPSSQNKTPM